MSSKLETIGTFRGKIADSAVTTTRKGFPQWVGRLEVTEKYVDDPAGMAHFNMQEPGWANWSEYGEEITAYLVLFNNPDVFDADSKMLNYDQLQSATGWDGSEFDSLGNGSLLGKTILFRTEENTYEGKTRIQVNWIDKQDADPVRSLKSLSGDDLKALSSKLRGVAKKPVAAKPAKPSPAPSVGGSTKSSSTATPSATSKTSAPASAPAVPSASTTAGPKKPAKTSAPAGVVFTKETAWETLMKIKGDNEDQVIADSWISATQEVAEKASMSDDTAFTTTQWEQVVSIVKKDLDLKS